MHFRLSFLVISMFAATTQAASPDQAESGASLDTIVVTAGGDRSVYNTAQPVTVLGSEDLDKNAGDNLGSF